MSNQPRNLNCPTCTSPMDIQTDSFGNRTAICPACGTTLDLGHGQKAQPNRPPIHPQGQPQVVQVNIPASSWGNQVRVSSSGSGGGCGCIGTFLVFGGIGLAVIGVIFALFVVQTGGDIEQALDDIQNSVASVFSPPPRLTTPDELYTDGGGNNISSVAYSSDGTLLIAGTDDGDIIIWDTESKEQINRWSVDQYWDIEALDISEDGQYLAVADSSDLFVYNISDPANERIAWSDDSIGSVYDVEFTANNLYLLTAHSQDGVKVWNLETGAFVREMTSNGYTRYITSSADSQLVATVYSSDGLRVWNIETGELEESIKFDGLSDYPLAFSPDGDWLAVVGSSEVYLFNTDNWKREKILKTSETIFSPRAVAFSPDSKYIAAVEFFGTDVVWDVESGRIEALIEDIETGENLAFSADSKQVATIGGYYNDVTKDGNGHQVRVWTINDDEEDSTSGSSVTPTPTVTPKPN